MDTLGRVTTLLFAVAILLVGHGLQLTLLPVHALSLGWPSTLIGLTGSAYFVGFVTGCLVVPGVVSRVGHIRSFMVMAAGGTIALLAAALFVDFWAWLVFRFVTGLALSGLYMIVESWLTDVSPKNQRGSVLSVYLAISLIGMAVGQLPMLLGVPGDTRLFMVAAMAFSLAIIPVGLTRIASPKPIPVVSVTPRTLLSVSRVAVVSAFMAGMVTGAFWTIGPVAGSSLGLEQGQIGLMMSVGVLGGAAAQYPVGRLSDNVDRRLLIGIIAAIGAAVAGLGVGIVTATPLATNVVVFLICAAAMPVYALCIALAAENTELSLVELTGGMLLAHGTGSIVGPILGAPLMTLIGPSMFFVFCSACFAVTAIWAFYRLLVVERPVAHQPHRPMLPKTTQAVAVLLGTEK